MTFITKEGLRTVVANQRRWLPNYVIFRNIKIFTLR